MKIKKVEVKNFRSLKDTVLECDDLTAIVGRNGAGKSSFLFAIKNFYHLGSLVTEEDFYDRKVSETIEIRVTFHFLTTNEQNEFSLYVHDDELVVTKKYHMENEKIVAKYFGAIPQIPQFAAIRAIESKTERRSAWKALAESNQFEGLEPKVKSADEVESMMVSFEDANHELLDLVEKESQFLGPRNVGGGKLDKHTKFVLIPAVRDVLDEMTNKQGAISQILEMIVNRKINAREDVRNFRTEFDEKFKQVFNSDNLTELPELGKSISKTLGRFAPGSVLNLEWDDIDTPEVKLPPPFATLTEDEFEGDITRKGHGLQRALILTLLQHLAVAVPYEEGSESDVSEEIDLILAIEEPELYLHPSRARLMAETLMDLSENPESSLGSKNQIIYTTHSPFFVGLDRFDNLRKILKTPCEGGAAAECKVAAFSLEQLKNELARICDTDSDKFTRESARIRSISIMNSVVNEGFFADVVVVVEGDTEVGMLWQIQEILGLNWLELNIAIVPADGKNNIDRPTVIFNGLSIPTYFIFDGDSSNKGTSDEKSTIVSNLRLLRLGNGKLEEFPKTIVTERYAVLEDKIETEFSMAVKGTSAELIAREIAVELGLDSASKVSKNMEGAVQLIKKLYDRGERFGLLEEIAHKVTSLHPSR